jgi:DNA adenine methylase
LALTKQQISNRGEPNAKVTAFLRWVGGKRQLVQKLLPYFPDDVDDVHYHEPFAGAASLYFALSPRKATLSDLNGHLIECYKQIRDNYANVSSYLRRHERNNNESYYYAIRELYNRSAPGPAQAARFIYLNRTCFNGVFRVNTHGKFNVPFGDKPQPIFPDIHTLAQISRVLQRTKLLVSDYEGALKQPKKSEFVYLDPPYPPLNGTAFFTHYTADRFGRDNQSRLAKVVRDLDKRGVRFLMTNADLPEIRKLYGGFTISELSVTRYVSCKGTRHRVGELVITNYSRPSVTSNAKSDKR